MESSSLNKFAKLDFPMFWSLESLRVDGSIILTEAFGKRKSLETTDMPWRMFAIDLVICFEQFGLKNHEKALESLIKCDEDIDAIMSWDNPLSVYCPEALEHVVVASRGWILAAMPGLLARGTTLLEDCLVRFKENIRVPEFQSMLIGIRSAVFMAYGVPGMRQALDYAGEAMKLDNEVAEWHFLYGKCTGRLRRVFTYTDVPSDFELKHHKLAVTLTNGQVPYYIVYVAQCQREMAFRLGRCEEVDVPLSPKCIRLLDESNVNYRAAYEVAPTCSHVLTRCALGFLKLPDHFNDVGLANKIMVKVLDWCPENPMVLHIWALINERGYRNPKTALIFFQKAAEKNIFVGWKDLIRLTYLENKKAYDPVPDLTHMLTLFPDAYLKQRILLQIGSFYLFQKNNVFKALDYIMEVFNNDPGSQNLTIHRNIFMGLGRPINLLQITYDYCRSRCAHPKTKDFVRKKCKAVVIIWTLMYPELSEVTLTDSRREIMHESFVYTHPWFRRQGRERRRREVKQPVKKTNSQSRSKSCDQAKVENENEPIIQPYCQRNTTQPQGDPYIPRSYRPDVPRSYSPDVPRSYRPDVPRSVSVGNEKRALSTNWRTESHSVGGTEPIVPESRFFSQDARSYKTSSSATAWSAVKERWPARNGTSPRSTSPYNDRHNWRTENLGLSNLTLGSSFERSNSAGGRGAGGRGARARGSGIAWNQRDKSNSHNAPK